MPETHRAATSSSWQGYDVRAIAEGEVPLQANRRAKKTQATTRAVAATMLHATGSCSSRPASAR